MSWYTACDNHWDWSRSTRPHRRHAKQATSPPFKTTLKSLLLFGSKANDEIMYFFPRISEQLQNITQPGCPYLPLLKIVEIQILNSMIANTETKLRSGSSSGGREGWLVTARLLVRSPRVKVSLSMKRSLTAHDQLAVALNGWLCGLCLIRWMSGKCTLFTITPPRCVNTKERCKRLLSPPLEMFLNPDASIPSCTFDVISGPRAFIAFTFVFVIVSWNWLVVVYR